MKQNHPDALFSKYVIDGVKYDVTPSDMLDECMLPSDVDDEKPDGEFPEIWDETVDTPPENIAYSVENIPIYIKDVTAAARQPRTGSSISAIPSVSQGRGWPRRS